MHRIVLALACVACASHGKQVPSASKQVDVSQQLAEAKQFNRGRSGANAAVNSMEALALLLASRPSAAFMPSGLGKRMPPVGAAIATRSAHIRPARSAAVQLADEDDAKAPVEPEAEPEAQPEGEVEVEPEGQPEVEVEVEATQEEPAANKTTAKVQEDDLLNSLPFLKRKLQVLEKEIDDCQIEVDKANEEKAAQLEEYGPKRERLELDLQGFRQQHEKQVRQQQAKAKAALIKDFLPVVDNLDRVKANLKVEGEEQAEVNERYSKMREDLFKVLDSMGVETIKAVGEPFDMMKMMAVQQVTNSEYPEGVVCEEMGTGYIVDGEVVREAYVRVSRGAAP